MNLKIWYSGLVVATLAGLAPAQDIQRLDPLANKIAPQNARLERVLTGFDKWTEGPVWTHQGSLLFAEIPANKIDRWVPGGAASVFIHPSGYTGAAPYTARSLVPME